MDSNEKLDRLLSMSPVYNFATYDVLALAEMTDAGTVVGKPEYPRRPETGRTPEVLGADPRWSSKRTAEATLGAR